MHQVKAQRSEELFVKNMLILQHHFAMLDFETILTDIGN